MAGLMGAIASGGAQGFARGTEQNSSVAQNMNMQQMNIMVRELMDARVAERAATADKTKYDRSREDVKADRDATHQNRLEEIKAHGAASSKAAKDPLDQEAKKFSLEQAKRKDAAMQEWVNLSEQYYNAEDDATKQYLFPMLRSVESKLSAMGVNPRGTTSQETKEDPLTNELSTKSVTKTGVRTQAPSVSGLPAGAKQIGTSGGKPVYQTPDGKKFIGD